LHYPLRTNISYVVDNALDYSAVVANVKECEMLSVLATACNPATNRDGATNVLGPQATTELGSK
jgi:hypothetical protein